MEDFNKKLEDYARLVVDFGANVQKDKPVRIKGPVDSKDFVRMLVKRSYERGASQVKVVWTDDFCTQQKYLYADEKILTTVEDFEVAEEEYYMEADVTEINIYSEDPELLKDVDPERLRKASMARSKAFKHLMKYTMNDIVSWTIVSVPTPGWAKAVFPRLQEDEAMARLWEDIFDFVRVNGKTDPVKAWEDHLDRLGTRAKILNDKQLKELRYTSKAGTDLVVGLPKNHIWGEARAVNANGVQFIPNMPTEEIYCAPDKNKVDGRVLSTKPLAYKGSLIEGMDLKFEGGRLVDYKAAKGEETLRSLVEMDQGAARLGEVALVEFNSPISQSNTVYFNTLFDENASCHLAFGKAYPTNIEGGEDLDEEGLNKAGINDSLVHEDFMIGDDSLRIVGIEEDGSEFLIFEDGNFAF